jgi:hypothetical protein
MIDPESLRNLSEELRRCMETDRKVLDELRADVRSLRDTTRRIQPRATTAISLVATDGGNNRFQFDPFLIQLVRVVDSSENELCLEVITPTSDIQALDRRQFHEDGTGRTALGRLIRFLGLDHLWELSPMIPAPRQGDGPQERPSPSWVQVYRDLVEWAILFELVRERAFGTDTLIIRDGLLRTKVFSGRGNLFARFRSGLQEGIDRQRQQHHRRIYLAGVVKHSQVLQRYRLAMSLERVMQTAYPCFTEVPRELEEKSYRYKEFARGDEEAAAGGEENKFVGGKMFFVKFGSRPHDPIWPVDLWQSQAGEGQVILGHMLADAIEGFPVPFYPRCLQKAHENAALVDFDLDILQAGVFDAIRESLGPDSQALDVFRLTDSDPSALRYNG